MVIPLKDIFCQFTVIKTEFLSEEKSEILNIHKKLTFHWARHTFATTLTLASGLPMETVSKLLGHIKLSTTQIHARAPLLSYTGMKKTT